MSLNFNISTDLLYSMYILHAYLAAQYLYSFEDWAATDILWEKDWQ